MCVIGVELRRTCASVRSFAAVLVLISAGFHLGAVAAMAAKTKPPALSITTASLPNGVVRGAYSTTLMATGGTPPYTWSLTGGSLPGGLGFSNGGTLSGTPSAAADAVSLTFKVTDSSRPAQNQSATFSLTILAGQLTVTTGSLPSGQVGTSYNASLSATGGTPPYTWVVAGGTLTDGLSLSPGGAISGTPTDATTIGPLTFKVIDSASQNASSQALSIIINTTLPSVSVSPQRAGLTLAQPLVLTATASDGGNLNWSASGSGCGGTGCGTFSAPSTSSGSPVTYTAPNAAGQYTLTATDASNAGVATSISIGVTDLAGVATYHNNVSRNGVNAQEYVLTPSSVSSGAFGKLFSCPTDGAIYAQPLWVANLMIGGGRHNVVFVATQHDSLYAFDADANPCTTLWQVSLIDTNHGGTAGETSVANTLVGVGYGDIAPEIGVTGTPVIDLNNGLLYVISKSVDTQGNIYQRLHEIDLSTGSEKLSGGPTVISGTFPANSGNVNFVAKQQNQRAGLALVNGVVYAAWGSHEDADPWYGWVMGFDAASLSHLYTFNTTPNTSRAGVWMGGGAPSVDSSGNLYVITGNGGFDASNSAAPNNDYGDSFLKLTNSLTVSQYFTPADQSSDNSNDVDFGSGGTSVVVDLPLNGSLPNHLVVGGGKDGYLCLLNRDKLGGYSRTNKGAVQMLNFGNGIFGTPAYWNWSFYLAGEGGKLQQFTLNSSTYKINTSPTSTTSNGFSFPGTTPSISTRPDNSNAIVWALDNSLYCTPQSPGCGPAVLHAYDATNLGTELWNSSQSAGNTAGLAVKFTVPTVANGKVYVGTRGNDSQQSGNTDSIAGELEVYGLLPN